MTRVFDNGVVQLYHGDARSLTWLDADPFVGSGSTLVAAQREGFRAIGVDLNRGYLNLATQRLAEVPLPMRL